MDKKYFLGVSQLGIVDGIPEIEIDFYEYNSLRSSIKCLSMALELEEIYSFIVSNYIDFESFLFEYSLSSKLFDEENIYVGFQRAKMDSNRRLVNILTVTRMYSDQATRKVKCIFSDAEEIPDFAKMKSEKYDSHFEYRFMEAIRNHVQHGGLGAHSIRRSGLIGSKRPQIEIFSEKRKLMLNSGFKKAISNEMPERVDVLEAIKVYLNCLSSIHFELRKRAEVEFDKSRRNISSAVKRLEEKQAGIVYAPCIIESEDGCVVEELSLILDWDDTRKA